MHGRIRASAECPDGVISASIAGPDVGEDDRLATIHLQFLGAATIRAPSEAASALAARRHPMALLALLSTAPSNSLTRGKLVGLLWPDSSEQVARNRLSTCVHQVRRALGNDVLESAGDAMRLAPGAVGCDVSEFIEAIAGGDHARAVAGYGGPFLDGFHLGGSSTFEEHVLAERERLAQACDAAVEALAEAADNDGRWDDAVRWWRRRAADDRCDARVAMRLMAALGAGGNPAEALRVARAHARAMADAFDSGPDPRVQALAARLVEPGTADPSPSTAGDAPSREARTTIAVLPFDHLGAGAEADPFAAGLHGDLLVELARIGGLTVIARTSVLCYRDSRRPVREIARELGADFLVEGVVQASGGRLRVSVQLIDAGSGGHVWAERYDRALTTGDLFDIQSELVDNIVRSLRAELSPSHPPGPSREGQRPTDDLEAYRLHAQGQQQLVQLTDASLQRAVAYFRGAIERDPDYALAWVGLSDALTARVDYAYETSPDAMAEAEAAVRHALALQPDLAEARAGLGKLLSIQRRGPEAIRELTRATALVPGYGQAHDWLSWTLQCLGRPGPALAHATRAVELDPLLREAVSNLAISHLANGLVEQALVEARRIRELAPGWTSGAFYEGLVLHRLGRFAESQAVLQGLVVEWADSGPDATLALACAGAGDTARARRLQSDLAARGEWFSAGLVQLALGDADAAFAAFERVADWGAYWPTLAVHQYFPGLWAPLAGDARFRGVRANIHRAWGLAGDGGFPDAVDA